MRIYLLVVMSMLLVLTGVVRADAPATQPAAAIPVDEAMMTKAPVVLRVKWKKISPPGGNPSDTVEVLQVIKNTSDHEWGRTARIDHEPGQDGVPRDQACTVCLEISEKLRGHPWALLGGGANTGVSHVGPRAVTQPATSVPPVDKDAAATLIRQLGDDDYGVREAASRSLIALGEGVRPMLAEKAKEKILDAEVADRIHKVLAILDRAQWPAIKGKVVDPNGNPVANARVRSGTNANDAEALTEADGTFVLRLRPGTECQRILVGEGGSRTTTKVSFKPQGAETMVVGVIKLRRVGKQ